MLSLFPLLVQAFPQPLSVILLIVSFRTAPPSGSATLGHSHNAASPSSGSNPSTTHNTHNVNHFEGQNTYDDGTIHGRVPNETRRPHPKARIPFYQARAANAIVTFNTVFGANPQK
jgi:hypothetical protein